MYWTPKEAASAWKCSESTARRLMHKEPAAREAGAARPKAKKGNPLFGTSEYQRGLAARRWEGHVSKAHARLIVRGLIDLEIEREVAKAREVLGDSVNPDEDNEWEPYLLADLEDEEKTEPFYTEQSLRDKAARKAARTKQPEAGTE